MFLSILRAGQIGLQRLSLVVFAGAALGLGYASLMAVLGIWPWIELPVSWKGEPVQQAGLISQLALTALAVGLCVYLPSNRRILALETSHRRFDLTMQDVARAYEAVHAADRGGVFDLKSEFEAVRDRLAYLRDHPDLGNLEPPLLELAAQMSYLSKELAEVYSDAHVTRARAFLQHRQEEVTRFEERLNHARSISDELKHWLHEVQLEERLAAAKLDALCADLIETLPELGLDQPRMPGLKVVGVGASPQE